MSSMTSKNALSVSIVESDIPLSHNLNQFQYFFTHTPPSTLFILENRLIVNAFLEKKDHVDDVVSQNIHYCLSKSFLFCGLR
jgi:hypothetical protein